jgi:DNA-binding beta-propeller fold protein YncE
MSFVSRVSSRTTRRAIYFALATLVTAPCLAAADEVFKVTTTINIPGNPLASFDISWVDPSLHAYFLADRSNKSVDIIDTATKTVTRQIGGFVGFTGNNDTSGPDGLLTLENKGKNEIWVGDGNSTLKVIDYASGTITHTISTGGTGRADELCYDPAEHLVMIANDADSPPFVSFIPTQGPNAYTVVKQIKFDGQPGNGPKATDGIEQCQWSQRVGLIYLNLPEVNGSGSNTADGNVVVIDPRGMAIIGTFDVPVADCAGPQGMAIGPAPQILLGCNSPSIPSGIRNSAVINENTGKIKRVLIDEGGADEVWFNPGDGHYFISGGSHRPDEQFGIVDSTGDTEDQTVVIAATAGAGSAHSVAADPFENEAYVPIPNNAGSTICPTANGCIAVFRAKHDDDRVFVRRDHDDHDHD